MNETVVIAICSLLGTFGGIIASSRLTIYRIEQLEKKVDKHNNVISRTYLLEKEIQHMKEQIQK